MPDVDHNEVINKLRTISGHSAWRHEGNRYEAVQMASSRPEIANRVREALARVVADGATNDIKSECRVPNRHPDENDTINFDSVSIGVSSIDVAKLNRAVGAGKRPRTMS